MLKKIKFCIFKFFFLKKKRYHFKYRYHIKNTTVSYPPYDDYNRIYRQCRVDDFTFYECT